MGNTTELTIEQSDRLLEKIGKYISLYCLSRNKELQDYSEEELKMLKELIHFQKEANLSFSKAWSEAAAPQGK